MKKRMRRTALSILVVILIQILINVAIPINSMAVDETNSSIDENINIGDYVNYMPDTDSITTYSAEKLKMDILGMPNSSILQDKLNWQVLRKYDDGSIDLIGSTTNQPIEIGRVSGYNNGVFVLNDICESLYSRKEIKARSVNLKDMEEWLTEEGKDKRQKYIWHEGTTSYGNTKTYLDEFSYYPNLYEREIGSGINLDVVNTNGIDSSNRGYNAVTDEKYSKAGKLTVTQTYYDIAINSNNYGEAAKILNSDKEYWVASRATNCEEDMARFGIISIHKSQTGLCMFDSNKSDNFTYAYIRPVVHIDADFPIIPCKGTNSENNMHTISWDGTNTRPLQVNIKNSITTPTNQNVTVTITANKEIQEVEGWTLSTGKTILTKKYTENTEETVKIKDLAGNITTANVKIANIDKIAPKAEVSYSTTDPVNGRVKVEISVNETIQVPEGWIYDEENNIIYKEYDANTEETTTITDLAGNETKVKIKVDNIINSNSQDRTIENNNIDNTISTIPIPKAGIKINILIALIFMIICGYISYKKYGKYKDIK